MKNLELIRGDTAKFKFQRIDADGNPIMTVANELYFTVKENTKTKPFVFQKTLDDMTFDEEGFYHFVIEPEDTNGLQYWDYSYDVEVIQNGVKTTVAIGKFNLLPEVTWVQNEGGN